MTDTPSNADDLDLTDPHAARRHKLEEITAKGIDPWGQRFDDRLLVSECRDRIPQIQWQQKDGETIALPDVESEEVDYRQWKADNGPGEEIGPIVRVAGRILLARPTGKLIFMNIRDWTGDIQIFVGKKQVGDENFDLAKLFDLGDLIGVQGRLGRTNTGELTVFAEELILLTKMLEVPPEKHAGMTNQDLRQRMRYADLAFNDGVMQTFLDRTKIIKRVLRSRRPDAAHRSRWCRCSSVRNASQRFGHEADHADRVGTAPQAIDGRWDGTRLRTGTRLSQ